MHAQSPDLELGGKLGLRPPHALGPWPHNRFEKCFTFAGSVGVSGDFLAAEKLVLPLAMGRRGFPPFEVPEVVPELSKSSGTLNDSFLKYVVPES